MWSGHHTIYVFVFLSFFCHFLVAILLHLLSSLRIRWPAHLHLASLIFTMISFTWVCFLISVFLILSLIVMLSILLSIALCAVISFCKKFITAPISKPLQFPLPTPICVTYFFCCWHPLLLSVSFKDTFLPIRSLTLDLPTWNHC